MSSIQLIEQCATRLRGIVEALDNIHDTSPHRWSTDLDDVHSSAESLLALINDQAPARSDTSFEEWLANELEGEDGQPVPAAVCDIALARRAFNHWPKLEKPAQVGAIRFHAGLSSRLVVEAAQRAYEYKATPEQEAERIERLQAFREQLDPLNLAPHAEAFNEAPDEALKPEQAEAERPEVVAYRTIGRHEKHQHPHFALNYYKQNAEDQAAHWRERGCEVSEEELMTVAQHERIVKAWIERWKAYIELSAKIAAQRDAALARVAELENGTVYVEARQCDECQHGGINDSADGLAACHDCDWTGPEPDEDKCPGCHRENCMAAACPECGGRYELVADANIAAPPAQAGQVPEEVRTLLSRAPCEIEHLAECLENVCEDEEDVDVREDVADGRVVAADIAHMLAAAPGKEVPQAWLDVQAERRRQIEAEGWTPEHDDAHSHGEMARAAACYALAGSSAPNDGTAALLVSLAWPWDEQWWKPSTARRDMVKACALGLAEIERLDRVAASQGGPSDA
ncbi:hypothetical protein [Pseudomonas aeruginosa]|uniref:hypothetical protein n=1 Tax=Pseudomonas aeruginosa TaxID=287 RepID=UPI002174D944|nr:hypothetical protein [Pseudomonas aeruginosa]